MMIVLHVSFSVMCKRSSLADVQAFVLQYNSTEEGCPLVVSVETPELGEEGEVWVIESEVALGRDCDYTLHLTARNGAGDTNYTGTLSIS